MIECMNVYKRYPTGTNALYDINVKVEQGEFIYIIGPTGSGKSTLIKLLDGEEKATKGKVKVVGIDVGTLRRSQIPIYRRNIGVVFQDFRLLPTKTVFENISYALEVINMKKKMIRIRVKEIMDVVGLSEKGNAFPAELSGGQQQRVAIARGLALNPEIIFFDEPTSALDPEMIGEVLTVMTELAADGMTMLVVTHEMNFARRVADRIVFMDEGAIVEENTPKEFFECPRSRRARDFLSSLRDR
jgi:cell division transport system ATP-binding protein